MNFWEFLYRLGPGWPSERQWATIMTILLSVGMLVMTIDREELWKEELFKTLITVVLVSGFVNMILSFHFSANHSDDKKAENTGKAFEAISKLAEGPTGEPEDPVHTKEGK